MESLYAQRSTAIAFAVCWAISYLLVWLLHRQWWRIRAVRTALWLVPCLAFGVIFLWAASVRAGWFLPTIVFAVASGFAVTAAVGLVVALPFTGTALSIERLVRWLSRGSRRTDAAARDHAQPIATAPAVAPLDDGVDRGRRSFITVAAAALPALTVGAAGAGVAASYGRTRFPNVEMRYPNLPPALDGLRVLHLSDVHLGYFVGLDDLEQTMLDAQKQRPDVVLVTGDLSDNLSVLPDAIRMIDALKPRYGTYASIGNHEYYRGIDDVLRAFEAGPIPMLIDASTAVDVGGARLFIAGADDPARSGRFNNPTFLRGAVERSIDAMPSDAFSILMSHRPEGFDVAAGHGVDLTVSGHYHGGIQLGLNGRAIIQGFAPEKYYWGHYRKGDSQLYTSGGVGHWFPFRLNCPPEAPVYVLRRA
jgi:predicted MPP superfamily phosphohydrolase